MLPTALSDLGRRTINLARFYLRPSGARLRMQWWSQSFPAIPIRLINRHTTYVGVTGSCGKTTTAKMIGLVLSEIGECRTNIKTNSVRQIAESVMSLPASTKFSVNELCAARPGKIRAEVRILRPHIGVVTTIGTDHYKNYRTREATAEEKGILVEAIPQHGTAILNADDPYVHGMASRCRARVLTYGLSNDADVRAVQVSSAWPNPLSLTVIHETDSVDIVSNMMGTHWATSILAAVTCGVVCGLDLKTCGQALANAEPVFGRYSVHRVPAGPDFVFDHKAAFWTLPFALNFIAQANALRKTLVLGNISDYGGAASPKYRKIARDALEVADRVIFVGSQSSHVSKLRQGEVRNRLFDFQTVYQAAEFIKRDALAGELILLKGSLTADHLERIILHQNDAVVCWRERCGVWNPCQDCRNYRTPSRLPLGMSDSQATAHK